MNDLNYVLKHNLYPSHVLSKKWIGKPIEPFSCADLAASFEDKRRAKSVLEGNYPDLSGYVDWANFQKTLAHHRYVLFRDSNKARIWLADHPREEALNSVRWLLSRCRKYQSLDSNLVPQSFEFLSLFCKNIDKFRTGTHSISKDFDRWVSVLSKRKISEDPRLVVLTYIGSLCLDSDLFHEIFKPLYIEKLAQVIREYVLLPTKLKILSRNPTSVLLTTLVNICLEFDIIDNPLAIFNREWDGEWSLAYHGHNKWSWVEATAEYDFCTMLADNRPMGFMGITKIPDSVKYSHFYAAMQIKKRRGKNDLPYQYSNLIAYIIGLFEKNTSLEKREIFEIVRNGEHIYDLDCGGYVRLKAGQVEFLIALKDLGLKPFPLSLNHGRKLFGDTEYSRGYCFPAITNPHALRFIDLSFEYNTANVVEKALRLESSRILTLRWKTDFKRGLVTAETVLNVLREKATAGVPLAQSLCQLIP